jgi:hypothetical protein
MMTYRDAKPLLMAYGLVTKGLGFEEIIRRGYEANLPLLKLNWKRPPVDLDQSGG